MTEVKKQETAYCRVCQVMVPKEQTEAVKLGDIVIRACIYHKVQPRA